MKARASRWALLTLLAALLFAAFAAWRSGAFDSGPDDLPAPFPSPLTSWADHVAAIDRSIVNHRARGSAEATDWLSPSAEAAAQLDRANMTGRWQDYAAAEAALATAMARAIPQTRPHPLAARIAIALHRDGSVEQSLRDATADLQFKETAAQADATITRGDVALYRGDWRGADALYAKSQSLADGTAPRFRRAFILERSGDADAAREAWIIAANADPRPSRRMLSFAAIRLGNLELARGRWNDADGWYARAERLLPGDWRVAALRLQMRALRGDVTGAAAGMERLATTHNLPDLWDALALWRRAAGDKAGAAAAQEEAARGWAVWMARYPESAQGHAAEHALASGDRTTALTLARRNYAARPYGDAGALLAAALAANGQTAEALALVRHIQASGWRSTELDRLLFELTLLSGDTAAAEKARSTALARNPRAFDPAASLIRFGLH